MANIRSFKDLIVWQRSMDAAVEIFFTTKKHFPKDEQYSLVDQVRRSSRSVPANISEAWRKRRYPAAFTAKLNDAEGEAAETQTHLEMAKRCGFVTADQIAPLDREYEEILAMLTEMAANPEKWTIRK